MSDQPQFEALAKPAAFAANAQTPFAANHPFFSPTAGDIAAIKPGVNACIKARIFAA